MRGGDVDLYSFFPIFDVSGGMRGREKGFYPERGGKGGKRLSQRLGLPARGGKKKKGSGGGVKERGNYLSIEGHHLQQTS